jgi:hypothetical protein
MELDQEMSGTYHEQEALTQLSSCPFTEHFYQGPFPLIKVNKAMAVGGPYHCCEFKQ